MIIQYITDDGIPYDNEKDAKEHEELFALASKFTDNYCYSDMQPSDVRDALMKAASTGAIPLPANTKWIVPKWEYDAKGGCKITPPENKPVLFKFKDGTINLGYFHWGTMEYNPTICLYDWVDDDVNMISRREKDPSYVESWLEVMPTTTLAAMQKNN